MPRTCLDELIAYGSNDLLIALFSSMAVEEAFRLSSVCRAWALAAEGRLERFCKEHRWQLPRRARLQKASVLGLAWRPVFVSKACRACVRAAGDYAVRISSSSAPCLFLCGKCAKEQRVVALLQVKHLTLDVTGLSGRPLYTKKQSKFCADVSKASAKSLANASGARAEIVRHATSSSSG